MGLGDLVPGRRKNPLRAFLDPVNIFGQYNPNEETWLESQWSEKGPEGILTQIADPTGAITGPQEVAKKQVELTEEMVDLQRESYETGVERQEPYVQAAERMLPRQEALLDEFGQLEAPGMADPFEVPEWEREDFDFEADPGYQFRKQQGEQALERMQNARGGRFTPRSAMELMGYSSGLASQEYGAAHGRHMGEQTMDFGAYATKMPYEWGAYQHQAQEPWKQYLAELGMKEGQWGRMNDVIGRSPGAMPSMAGFQGATGDMMNAMMQQSLMPQQQAFGLLEAIL